MTYKLLPESPYEYYIDDDKKGIIQSHWDRISEVSKDKITSYLLNGGIKIYNTQAKFEEHVYCSLSTVFNDMPNSNYIISLLNNTLNAIKVISQTNNMVKIINMDFVEEYSSEHLLFVEVIILIIFTMTNIPPNLDGKYDNVTLECVKKFTGEVLLGSEIDIVI
jgi:hypothetical protein